MPTLPVGKRELEFANEAVAKDKTILMKKVDICQKGQVSLSQSCNTIEQMLIYCDKRYLH